MKKLLCSSVLGCLLLVGCDFSGQVDNASEILKQTLKSPSSFSLVNGEEVWSGEDSDGNSAHIVKLEYDAQNGFGAMIRDCKMVAFIQKDGKVLWNDRFGIDVCEVPGILDEQKTIESMRRFNFEKQAGSGSDTGS